MPVLEFTFYRSPKVIRFSYGRDLCAMIMQKTSEQHCTTEALKTLFS